MTECPKYGYYPKSSKAFLIVKQYCEEHAEGTFAGSNIKIATEGLHILVQSLMISMGNTFKDDRNSTARCLFCILYASI